MLRVAAQSDIGIVAALALVGFATYTYGFTAMMCFYGCPYLVVNYHLVLITYLQHTAVYIPHYRKVRYCHTV